jgi:hypothetical protein
MCLSRNPPSPPPYHITFPLYSDNLLPLRSQRILRPTKTRYKTPRHLLLDLELESPPRAVPRHEDLRLQFLEAGNGSLQLRGVAVGKVEAADDSVQRCAAADLEGMPADVDDTGVAAAGEDDEAFSWGGVRGMVE